IARPLPDPPHPRVSPFCDDVLARIDAPPPPPKRRQARPEYRAGMGVRQAGLLRRWLVPLAAVASLVAAVGLAGGFRDAEGYAGPAVDPGEEITLARWRITVDEAELIDRDPPAGERDLLTG